MLTDIEGVRVGHWTDLVARTGCTVALFPAGTVASAEVRGGAPATRELDLLAPDRTVAHLNAAVLTGGSAFGLASADGVMRFCEERGMGVATPAGAVPIVPTLALFDLMVGDPSVRPGAEQGYAACVAASDGPVELGRVGAGTGATIGNWRGPAGRRDAGIVGATNRVGDLAVSALMGLNAFGDLDPDGHGAAAAIDVLASADKADIGSAEILTNTTIGVVATNARLDKVGCLVVAQGAHDGLARSLVPPHTRVDGDAFVAAATGRVDADIDAVRLLALATVERAVRSLAHR